jgi:hypothetical protein
MTTTTADELVGQLRDALANLDEYILRRAQELTEPLVDQVRAEAAERVRLADRQFVDDAGFEQRLRTIMRRDPQLLERWIRQRNRINGGISRLGL